MIDKGIAQIRYHGDNSEYNYPSMIAGIPLRQALSDGTILKYYGPVTQLGIQGYPGLEFVLNLSGAISIGATGIYELDLEGIGSITSLRISESELDKYNSRNDPYDRLIIDIIYEKNGG